MHWWAGQALGATGYDAWQCASVMSQLVGSAVSPNDWLCGPAECFCCRLTSGQDKPLVLIGQRKDSKMVLSSASVMVVEQDPKNGYHQGLCPQGEF